MSLTTCCVTNVPLPLHVRCPQRESDKEASDEGEGETGLEEVSEGG